MHYLLVYFLLALLSGRVAASPTDYPEKRVLTPEQRQAMGPVDVVLVENLHGVRKGWDRTDTRQKGAEWGVIGEAVAASRDAVANFGPEQRARLAADRLDAIAPTEWLGSALAARLMEPRMVLDPGARVAVTVNRVSIERVMTLDPLNGVVQIAASYLLTDDARTFCSSVYVRYTSDRMKYTTPYPYRKVPAHELRGPVYQNTFVYRSRRIPVPPLTPELKTQLIADIQAHYRDAGGALPQADTKEGKALKKELELAGDAELSKNELSILLMAHWLENDGALLRSEIEKAHSFFVTHVMKDLNESAIPSFNGADETLEATEDHVVLRLGSGRKAGYVISMPVGTSDVFDVGNGFEIAARNERRLTAAVDERVKEQRARKSKRTR
jgi:hypothetical protein